VETGAVLAEYGNGLGISENPAHCAVTNTRWSIDRRLESSRTLTEDSTHEAFDDHLELRVS